MTLAEWRKLREWTRNELARRSGVHPTTLGYIERGIVRNPRLETILRVCVALGTLPEEVDEFSDWAQKEEWIKAIWRIFDETRARRRQTIERSEI